jgi:putative ABC transport system permease protein
MAEVQKQLDGMDSDVYQEYVKIPEEDRNEEQQAYVNKWENLNAQFAGIQAQKTQLETAKSGLLAQAGFATEADLDAQI